MEGDRGRVAATVAEEYEQRHENRSNEKIARYGPTAGGRIFELDGWSVDFCRFIEDPKMKKIHAKIGWR